MWEGLQVGPDALHGGYRPEMVQLHLNTDMTVASGTTLANAQYGAGGTIQHFFDIKGAIVRGDVSVLDHAGNPIHIPDGIGPKQVDGYISKTLGHGTISLHHPTHVNLGVADQQMIKSYHFEIADHHFASRHDVRDVLEKSGTLVSNGDSIRGAAQGGL